MITQELINKAKEVPITDILASIGLEVAQVKGNELVYHSPLHGDKTPSFFVNIEKNRFCDFGDNQKGDSIWLIQLLKKISFPRAIDFLLDFDGTPTYYEMPNFEDKVKKGIEIASIDTLKHEALFQYAESRGIGRTVLLTFCKEIRYKNSNRNFFSIGFKNDSNGYELRSENFKSFAGEKKDISTINAGHNLAFVFEGFFSFLSHIVIFGFNHFATYIVLNSVSNLSKLGFYNQIASFLDNDEAGQKGFEILKRKCNSITNEAKAIYPNHKDLNDLLTNKK